MDTKVKEWLDMAQKQIIEKIRLFIDALKKANVRVEKVYLFGSYVLGGAHEYSDVDIAVISPDFGKNFLEESIFLLKTAHKIDLLLSPEPYSLHEYNNASKGDFLWQEIIQKGLPIEH